MGEFDVVFLQPLFRSLTMILSATDFKLVITPSLCCWKLKSSYCNNCGAGGFQGQFDGSLTGMGLDTSYQQFSFTNIDVPDTADAFLVRFQIAAGGVFDISNSLYVDDVVLTTSVPEPSVIGLIAIGFIGLASRRRRTA